MSFLWPIWHRKFISFGAFPLKTERLAWTPLAKTCSTEHTKEHSVTEINKPLPCTSSVVFFSLVLMPWQEPHLAPIFVNQQVITRRQHTVENRHKLFTGTKKTECKGSFGNPTELWSDEWWADRKNVKYFWEVPGPITAPSQEIASSLGKTVALPLAFFSVAWWVFLPFLARSWLHIPRWCGERLCANSFTG